MTVGGGPQKGVEPYPVAHRRSIDIGGRAHLSASTILTMRRRDRVCSSG